MVIEQTPDPVENQEQCEETYVRVSDIPSELCGADDIYQYFDGLAQDRGAKLLRDKCQYHTDHKCAILAFSSREGKWHSKVYSN